MEQDADDVLHFTILAKDGKPIFSNISELAQAKDWPVAEFHVNRGELEDVFRTITQRVKEGQAVGELNNG